MSAQYVCDCCGRVIGSALDPPASHVRLWIKNVLRVQHSREGRDGAGPYSVRELDVCGACIVPIEAAYLALAERNAKAARK